MSVDDRALHELIVESQDLQVDALRDAEAAKPELADIGRSRRGKAVDLDKLRAFNQSRRVALRNGGLGMGALAARGLLATGFGAAITGIVASPANAQGGEVDVQALQTAASLENLAVATYEAALTLPFVADGNAVVKTFAMTTMEQHAAHGAAFNALAEELGGQAQNEPNPKYAPVVEEMKPSLTAYGPLVELAATLEEVATDTYLANVSLVQETSVKELMASIMGVEAQHLAVLRAVGALVEGGAPQLIALPPEPLSALPAAAGSVSFPNAMEMPDMASPPEEGAVA